MHFMSVLNILMINTMFNIYFINYKNKIDFLLHTFYNYKIEIMRMNTLIIKNVVLHVKA